LILNLIPQFNIKHQCLGKMLNLVCHNKQHQTAV
jgi:hypothetical protein